MAGAVTQYRPCSRRHAPSGSPQGAPGGFDLRAQSLDVHVDQAGVGGVAVAPHLLQQYLTGEDLAGLAGQRDQQVEQRVSLTSSPLRSTVWAGTSMVIWLPVGPIEVRAPTSSPRRSRARIRATSSFGLNGLTT